MRAVEAHRAEDNVRGTNSAFQLLKGLAKFKMRPRRRHGSIGMMVPNAFEAQATRNQQREVGADCCDFDGLPTGPSRR